MRVMFTAEQIARRVRELGLELARDYQDKRPLFVGVLKGACMFQCDLARATPIDLDLDFVSVSSYGAGKTSSGNVRLLMDMREDIADRHVVLCEGVVDSGPERVLHPRRDEAAPPREPEGGRRCSTRSPAAGSRCPWTTRAGGSAASSWWATAWTTSRGTATCPTSACSRRLDRERVPPEPGPRSRRRPRGPQVPAARGPAVAVRRSRCLRGARSARSPSGCWWCCCRWWPTACTRGASWRPSAWRSPTRASSATWTPATSRTCRSPRARSPGS